MFKKIGGTVSIVVQSIIGSAGGVYLVEHYFPASWKHAPLTWEQLEPYAFHAIGVVALVAVVVSLIYAPPQAIRPTTKRARDLNAKQRPRDLRIEPTLR
jgi:hypothetical protein